MINIEKIQEVLPHRYPFLLIDRVLKLDLEDKTIVCIKNVSINEPFFAGHFPDCAIMPGVLVIEAMAQAAGILGNYMLGSPSKSENIGYYLAGVNQAKFKRPIVPGDQLVLKANYQAQRKSIWRFICEALVEDKLVSRAEITCARKELIS